MSHRGLFNTNHRSLAEHTLSLSLKQAAPASSDSTEIVSPPVVIDAVKGRPRRGREGVDLSVFRTLTVGSLAASSCLAKGAGLSWYTLLLAPVASSCCAGLCAFARASGTKGNGMCFKAGRQPHREKDHCCAIPAMTVCKARPAGRV